MSNWLTLHRKGKMRYNIFPILFAFDVHILNFPHIIRIIDQKKMSCEESRGFIKEGNMHKRFSSGNPKERYCLGYLGLDERCY
jgi:hypothetical protein